MAYLCTIHDYHNEYVFQIWAKNYLRHDSPPQYYLLGVKEAKFALIFGYRNLSDQKQGLSIAKRAYQRYFIIWHLQNKYTHIWLWGNLWNSICLCYEKFVSKYREM